MRRSILLLTFCLFLAVPAFGQGGPTNDDLRLRNLNSQLRVKQLEFHELKERRDGLIYQVEKAERAFNQLRDRRNRLQQMIQRENEKAKAIKEAKKELKELEERRDRDD